MLTLKPRLYACIKCSRDKKNCDKIKPECGRCMRIGEPCVYKSSPTAARRIKPKKCDAEIVEAAMIPCVKQIVHEDLMLDKYFMISCLQSFDMMMGVLLTFKSDVPSSDHFQSNVATKVRTDSVLASICKAMGWVSQAQLFLDRAKHNAQELLCDEDGCDSSESSTALGLLSVASYGEDMRLSKNLMGHAVRKRFPGFEIDISQPINSFNGPYFAAVSNPTVISFTTEAMATLYQRVQLRAHYVRRALEARLSRDEIDRYGAFDYADHRGGYDSEECMDLDLACRLLVELRETERRLYDLLPKYSEKMQDVARIFYERRAVVANAVRCSLEYYTGDFAAARVSAERSFSAFGSVSSVLWFFGAAADYIMVINACIGMRDRALFERGMQIMRRMAPVYPPAEKIVFALSDPIITSLFESEEVVSGREKEALDKMESETEASVSSDGFSKDTLLRLDDLEDVAKRELDSWLSEIEAC